MRDEPLVAAIDVGGTSLKGALVTRRGEIVSLTRREVRDVPPGEVVDAVVALVRDVVADAAAAGTPAGAIGLAVPGVVDEHAGVGRSSMILGWRDVPFVDLVRPLGLPVAFGHDVSAGAYGEQVLGAARGHRDWLFLALGTGLGSTFVLGGRPYRGSGGTGGELAHVVVRTDGPPCRCGKQGCLEMLATAPAVVERYRESSGATLPDAASVAARAGGGDTDALAAVAGAAADLATAVATYVESMNPSAVVVGGGLAESGPLLMDPFSRALADATAFADPRPQVVAATLGQHAALVGVGAAAHHLVGHPAEARTVPFDAPPPTPAAASATSPSRSHP